jgi:hypothetical protein
MEKSLIKQENKINWYVSENPIEKYLNNDRVDYQIASKFVCINSEEYFIEMKPVRFIENE